MSLFSRAQKASFIELDIKFYKEAIHFGEHGKLVVTHKRLGLTEVPVSFVFVGIATPPKITVALITYLFEEAKAQGYIPQYLETYGNNNETVYSGEPNSEQDLLHVGRNIMHMHMNRPAGSEDSTLISLDALPKLAFKTSEVRSAQFGKLSPEHLCASPVPQKNDTAGADGLPSVLRFRTEKTLDSEIAALADATQRYDLSKVLRTDPRVSQEIIYQVAYTHTDEGPQVRWLTIEELITLRDCPDTDPTVSSALRLFLL